MDEFTRFMKKKEAQRKAFYSFGVFLGLLLIGCVFMAFNSTTGQNFLIFAGLAILFGGLSSLCLKLS